LTLERSGPGDFSRRVPDYFGIAAMGLLAYLVMAGDYLLRDSIPVAIAFDAAIGIGLVVLYVVRLRGRGDRLDGLLVVALVLFTVTAALSAFPRQSFDSALVALAYVAGLFIARDVLARPSARRILIAALVALSVTLTVIAAVSWLGLYLRWWSLTGWSVVPPLGMNLPSSPWGHRHDLAILLAMLYPAWWVGRIRLLRATAAVAIGLVDLALIIIGGSRMVWIAIVVATALLAAPWLYRQLRRNRGRLLLAVAGAAVVVVGLVISGGLGPLAERLLGSASLAERTAMWGPLGQAWTTKLVAGYGPGSFPWILQGTGYFDTNSFAPRHPDSAVVQLLAEGGLIGLAAMAIAVAAIVSRLIHGTSSAARWAVVAFGVAAIGGNPTDFHFMVALAIAWVAYALPHDSSGRVPRGAILARPLDVTIAGALVVIGVAFVASTSARIAYAGARTDVAAGQLASAEASLQLAAALDPGMALYQRQLGAAKLMAGDATGAMPWLRSATRINPNDDLAWRSLALAYDRLNDLAAAADATDRAVQLQRSDSANLLVSARISVQQGDVSAAGRTLAEVVQAWPEIIAAPGWSGLISGGTPSAQILVRAAARWKSGQPSPEPLDVQPLLIHALMSGSGDGSGLESGVPPTVAAEYSAAMACEPTASGLLDGANDADRRQATYWAVVAREANLRGASDEPAALLYTIMTGDDLLASSGDEMLNPLNENGTRGASGDRWGYRRQPIDWPPSSWQLPAERSGLERLFIDPTGAVRAAGLDQQLANCL
jgi:tetratricopeptide (TPR) repeat protein/O-antigen ligase